jgi:hypothetical protein
METELPKFIGRYLVHTHEERPFEIIIRQGSIEVRRLCDVVHQSDYTSRQYETDTVITQFEKYYLGLDDHTQVVNTLLVHLKESQYLSIGPVLRYITITGTILEYHSPLDKTGMPQPFYVQVDGIHLL